MGSVEKVRTYYNDNVLREWERMDRHPMEFEITNHYLKKYIKPGDKVLDVGGGPGRYSLMLAEMGCEVTLVDLSPANITFALERAGERGLKIQAVAGDALELDSLVKGPFDAVLNMGPLYHLLTEEERAKSICSCRNVLQDGGLLFAAVITLQAEILYYLVNDLALIMEPHREEYLRHVEQDVSFSGPTFTDAHLMRVWDFCPFMEKLGFETIHRVACEGLCSTREKEYLQAPADIQSRWFDLSLKLCERPEFLGLAAHLLYVGRKIIDRSSRTCP